MRKAFVPRNEDFTLLAADYSQIELRLMAHLSCKDEGMLSASNGEDIHAATAAKVYQLQVEQVHSREQRSHAKMVNFGIIYGISKICLCLNVWVLKEVRLKKLLTITLCNIPK